MGRLAAALLVRPHCLALTNVPSPLVHDACSHCRSCSGRTHRGSAERVCGIGRTDRFRRGDVDKGFTAQRVGDLGECTKRGDSQRTCRPFRLSVSIAGSLCVSTRSAEETTHKRCGGVQHGRGSLRPRKMGGWRSVGGLLEHAASTSRSFWRRHLPDSERRG